LADYGYDYDLRMYSIRDRMYLSMSIYIYNYYRMLCTYKMKRSTLKYDRIIFLENIKQRTDIKNIVAKN